MLEVGFCFPEKEPLRESTELEPSFRCDVKATSISIEFILFKPSITSLTITIRKHTPMPTPHQSLKLCD